jgi:dihydrofolate reductase
VAKLIYGAITSLDGYVADREGKWDWSIPDEEVHTAVNEVERTTGTYLLGRRMYDVLVAWETMDLEGEPAVLRDYQEIWRATDKVVYSRTLEAPASERTRIEREFSPEAVKELKEQADRDLNVGGPELAAQALAAGLVDEIHLFVSPIAVGGGTRSLPEDQSVRLELLDERRFGNGVVQLHYRVER